MGTETACVSKKETKDGKYVISVYFDDDAECPREQWDAPIHFYDWNRECSLMEYKEREHCPMDEMELYRTLLTKYADEKSVLNTLIENGKKIATGDTGLDTALVYSRPRKAWLLISTYPYSTMYSIRRQDGWYENSYYEGKRDDLYLPEILSDVDKSTMCYLVKKHLKDVKTIEYNFGYYGSVRFDEDVTADCDGVAYITKKDYEEYTGMTWKENMEGFKPLFEDIENWSDGHAYYVTIEKKVTFHVTKDCLSEEREQLVEDVDELELVDSCAGFYEALAALDSAYEYLGITEEDVK